MKKLKKIKNILYYLFYFWCICGTLDYFYQVFVNDFIQISFVPSVIVKLSLIVLLILLLIKVYLNYMYFFPYAKKTKSLLVYKIDKYVFYTALAIAILNAIFIFTNLFRFL